VALIAGGHTFGKAHGAGPGSNVGPDPRSSAVHDQGFGWINSFGTGKGKDTITSGLEGAWTAEPTKWDGGYFHNLFAHEWELFKSPAGAQQWRPKDGAAADAVPDAHDPSKKSHPIMFTTDLALIKDPEYLKISTAYHENNDLLHEMFAKAWYKLLHRDMGSVERLVGPYVPEAQVWQDPVSKGRPLAPAVIESIKVQIKNSGIPSEQLIRVAWNAASTWRKTDYRGGANGARLRLAPQKDWEVNDPAEVAEVVGKLEAMATLQGASVADMIVLGGNCGVEMAAEKAGVSCNVPFRSGRGDATQEQTDAPTFEYLKPEKDAFRNMPEANPYMMVDKAHMLNLTVPEMTVLVGGLRVAGGNCKAAGNTGVLTTRPGALTTDFFVNLTDMTYKWEPAGGNYVGSSRESGAQVWTASICDLTFGSNAELRNICETYACDDGQSKFLQDFCNAWAKVMNSDSYGKF